MEKLNLKEVCYLIVHKPLVIVKLEHSIENKKLITKAMKSLWQSPKGRQIFDVLREFLGEVAPKYRLNKCQKGVCNFLLREMDKLEATENAKPTSWVAGLLKFGVG